MVKERGGHTTGRQARRRQQTRATLLAAARHVMAEKGIEAATIAEIAEAADLGFGTFYNYFDSKDAIVDAIIAEAAQRHAGRLAQLAATIPDVAAALAAGVRYVAGLEGEDLAWMRFILQIGLIAPERRPVPIIAPLDAAIARGVAAGRFRVGDPTVARIAISGAVLAVMQARSEGRLELEAAQEVAVCALCLLGLSREEAEAAAMAQSPASSP